MPRSSTTSFDVPGIYAGRYLVRVRAINAAEISSGWGYSEEKTLTGKVGNPPKPVGFTATGINWGFVLTGVSRQTPAIRLKRKFSTLPTVTFQIHSCSQTCLIHLRNTPSSALKQGRNSGTARSWSTERVTSPGIPTGSGDV